MEADPIRQARQHLAADLEQKEAALTRLQADLQQAQAVVQQSRDKLAKFDEIIGGDAPVRRKPGPKPGAKRGRPAKAKAETTASRPKKKAEGGSRAVEGRRAVARGERPTIKDAIIQVIGGDVCNAIEVYERLHAKGWLPNATEPRQYISFVLSSTKSKDGKPVFERVQGKGRGYYRVAGVQTAKTEPVEDDTDQTLTEAGVIPAAPAN